MKSLATFLFTISFSCFIFGQNNSASKLITPNFKYQHFFKNEIPKDSLFKLKPKLLNKDYLTFTENEESALYNMPILKPFSEDKMPILKPHKEPKYHLRILKIE